MKTFAVFLLTLLVPFITAFPQEGSAGVCTVTYVANEGFIIANDNSKVLIDALFGDIKGNWCDQPGDSVSNLIMNGIAPFDRIDATLITHKHTDHFNAKMVIGFLKSNSASVVICPAQVNDLLERDPGYAEVSGRIRSFDSSSCPDTLFTVNNVRITAMRFNHGSYFITDSMGSSTDIHKDVENFGYLIEADSFKIFHSGDASASNKLPFERFGFNNMEFDIAFVDRVFLGRDGQEILNGYIRANSIVLMHVEPARNAYYQSVIRDYPQFVLFSKPLEKRRFTLSMK